MMGLLVGHLQASIDAGQDDGVRRCFNQRAVGFFALFQALPGDVFLGHILDQREDAEQAAARVAQHDVVPAAFERQAVLADHRPGKIAVAGTPDQGFDARAEGLVLLVRQQQLMHLLADDFLGRPAKNVLGPAIPFGDVTFPIPQDEGQWCRVVQGAIAQLAVAQRRLGLALLGDVAEGGNGATACIPGRTKLDVKPRPLARGMTEAQCQILLLDRGAGLKRFKQSGKCRLVFRVGPFQPFSRGRRDVLPAAAEQGIEIGRDDRGGRGLRPDPASDTGDGQGFFQCCIGQIAGRKHGGSVSVEAQNSSMSSLFSFISDMKRSTAS